MLAGGDRAGLDLLHLLRNEVDGAGDGFAAGREVCPGGGVLLIVVAHGVFGLVGDHDFGPGFGDPDHFANGALGVGEEVDAADMEDAIEYLGAKGEATRFSLEEARRPAPFLQFLAALVEHAPGDIETIEINVLRKIADVCAGADSDFEHARTWLDLKLGEDLAAKIELRLDQAVKGLGQVVTRGDAVVQGLVFQIQSG